MASAQTQPDDPSSLVWNIQGSTNSRDLDIVVQVDSIPLSVADVRAMDKRYIQLLQTVFPEVTKEIDINLVVIKDGIVVAATKGHPAKVNNAILTTYPLHEQPNPCLVQKRVERDLLNDSILACHNIFTCFTRTAASSDCSFCDQGCKDCNLYTTMIRNTRYSSLAMIQFFLELDLSTIIYYNCKDDQCLLLKSMAFQLGQSMAFLNNIELFTKDDIVDAYPQLGPFIRREITTMDRSDEHLDTFVQLNQLKNDFCHHLLTLLEGNEMSLLPALLFEQPPANQQAILMTLRDGYDAYLATCSSGIKVVVAVSPVPHTNAKKMRKYLNEQNINCIALNMCDDGHEYRCTIPLPC